MPNLVHDMNQKEGGYHMMTRKKLELMKELKALNDARVQAFLTARKQG